MKKHIETIPSEAMKALQNYSWPGNVRQLESVVESAAIRSDGLIRPAHVLRVLPELAALGTLQIKRAVVGSYGVQLINQEKQRSQKAILDAKNTLGGPTAPQAVQSGAAADRLAELGRLLQQGLITQAEYDARRQAILNQI